MNLGSIGSCVTALVSGFFLMAATSECEAADSRSREMLVESKGVIPPPIGVPRTSPDGSYIVFSEVSPSHLSGFVQRVFSVRTDGSRLYQIPDGPSAPGYFIQDFAPDISPDGSRIVYSTFRYSTGMPWNRVHSYEIATAKPDGSDAKRLTRNEYDDVAPVWSPDGRRIAFVSDRDGYPQGMYTMNSDGSDVRRIAPGSGGSPTLIWSPDGRHIAFSQSDRGEWDTESNGYIGTVYFVAIVGSEGSGYRRVIESDSLISGLTWSPDGSRMAFFTTQDKKNTLYIVGADGSNVQRVVITSIPESPQVNLSVDIPVSKLAWSPDGRRLAFLMRQDKKNTLYIVNADGSNVQQVVTTSIPESPQVNIPINTWHTWYTDGLFWMSDGSEILFYYGYLSDFIFQLVRPDGSGFRTLHTLQEGILGNLSVDVEGWRLIVYSPPEGRDGEVVLYTTALDGSDKRILVRSAYGELVAENSGWREDVPTCSTGDAVSDPGGNPGLVQDCETLLSIRDTMSVGDVELNWRAYTPIEDWWGISVGGSPRRVDGLGYPKPIGFELGGTIPPEIGDLTGLRNIALEGTQLTGPIPPELGNLSGLERLRLTTNQLSGNIPAELGKLTNLKELYLQFNALTGEIPAELGNLENLQELYLHSNNLSGCIPSEIRLSRPNMSVDVGLRPC